MEKDFSFLSMRWPGFILGVALSVCSLFFIPVDKIWATDNELISKLGDIKDKVEVLEKITEYFASQGLAVDYPKVDLAVLSLFIDYTAADINDGNDLRAENALDEMKDLLIRCRRDLIQIHKKRGIGPVPRYKGDPVRIVSNHFTTKVTWEDGSVNSDWPIVFNGYVGAEDLQADIEKIAALGVSMVSVEIGSSQVLVEKDTIDKTQINNLVEFLDKAHGRGIAVNLLISPHYFPQWAFKKWPDILINASEYCPYSVDAQEVRDVMKLYMDALIPEIKDHPGLICICLENEPAYLDTSSDPLNRSRYSEWLEYGYGTVEALSKTHGAAYLQFDDVPLFYAENWQVMPEGGNAAAVYDYFCFNDERFADWFVFLAGLLHYHAPDLPVHAKIPGYAQVSPLDGIDPLQFSFFSQIAGNDCSKLYNSHDSASYSSEWVNENYFFDLLHSLYGMPLFNSEDHMMDDHEDMFLPPEHIRNVLWQAAIHGQGASNTWIWGREYVDEETNEPDPDFTSILHQPALVAEHARSGLDLMRLARQIAAFVDIKPQIALLYSPTSLMYTLNEDHERLSYVSYSAPEDGWYWAHTVPCIGKITRYCKF